MNKRDKARQWEVVAAEPNQEYVYGSVPVHKCSYLSGDNRNKYQRLNEVTIGDWLKIERINSKPNSKEVYSVKFGGIEYIVRLNENNEYVVRLRWADSFVNAQPTNIGQLMNSTANAKRKRS